jgi:hypothetical protein
MTTRQVKNIIRYMGYWGYVVFKRPYELNIIGIRANSTQSDSFDDTILCFWYDDKGNLVYRTYQVSTDPGTFWLNNPMQPRGTAILKGGQYLYAWQLISSNRFGFPTQELMQVKEVTILRDYDRNGILDFFNGLEDVGLFGINIHTGTTPNQKSSQVGQWSAGCQVFAVWAEWIEFLALVNKHISLYGNALSYTLLDYRATARTQRRWGMYAVGAGIGAFSLYSLYKLTTMK